MTLLDTVLEAKYKLLGNRGYHDAMIDIKISIDETSPYAFCKMFRVLQDDSAEEFMIQFMTAFNRDIYPAY